MTYTWQELVQKIADYLNESDGGDEIAELATSLLNENFTYVGDSYFESSPPTPAQ